ncbi:MAG TPA: MopE-related protein [Polyangiaceae bacterium]|nr:MopE-related protein [Polyangiaceae bacterium]
MSPVTITDAHGVASSAQLRFDGDGYARLRVEHAGLAYPALIDFAVTLGNVQALAIAPTQIKGRVMVLLDTSGSMLGEFASATNTHGDSPVGGGIAQMCDNALGGSAFACNANVACTIANGALNFFPVDAAANPSRMLASKLALQNVVNANVGLLDFGLERYAEDTGCPNAANPAYCCTSQTNGTTRGRCQGRDNYADLPPAGDANDLTYAGGCGTTTRGGRVLIQPGAGSSPQLLPWVDFTEDFCSSTNVVGAAPRNPELRASGNTPLARAVLTAKSDWYQPTYTDSKTAGSQPLDDALIDCRPYVLVVMTDGDDTCNADEAIDCAGNNAQCKTNRCFSADVVGSSNPDTNCQCAVDADCTTGVCRTPTLVDCDDNVALCGAGSACVDTPGPGSNFRCSCATSADCGTGFTCNTTTPPAVDCRGNNARCISNNCNGNRCTCSGNAQCAPSQQCTGGICVTRGLCQATGMCKTTAPHDEVQSLTNVNATNPVKTYVLGMGDPAGLNQTELNAMAVSGGTAQARFATSQSDIEAAFADIVANTVKFEICNELDDNCNARIDEGLGVYQECLINTDCTGGATCDSGRCVCTGAAQCGAGYTCSNETPKRFCRPSCSEGQGACLVAGVRKCGVGVGQCCMNDTSATCNDIVPPAGTAEVCNGIDDNCNGFVDENLSCQGCVPLPEVCDGKDNDCDGQVDETGPGGLVDIGGPCGSSIGRCTPGTAACTNGTLVCSGSTGPFTEVCNGYDDDCDGVTDGMTQACYTGPANTAGVGTCHDGTQLCAAVAMSGVEAWGACSGQQLPTTEICNGLDDDCDNVVDNGIPTPTPGQVTGDACCSDKAPGSKCGTGQCVKGTWVCAGSVVVCANAGVPTNETCDNADNDCDGTIDNIPTLGGPCVAPGSCSGTLKCDSAAKQLVCEPNGSTGVEKCNGIDDDCDGKVDEIEDISVNDDWYGQDCDVPPAGHDKPPCKPGKYVCKNGAQACDGAVHGLDHEVCDLKDNDCDGKIDEIEDISVNDDWYGQDCDAPPAGHDKPPCKPGKYVCKNGTKACEGAVHGLDHEVCDLKDNDCDGIGDTLAACPGVNGCVQGVCVEQCHGGEFPCPGGYDCQSFPAKDADGKDIMKKYCVPSTCNAVECPPGASCKAGKCTLDNSGGAGNAGGAGNGTEGGDSSSTSGNGVGAQGGDNSGETGGSSAGGSSATAGSAGTAATGNTPTDAQAHGIFGLVTGGGGCACRMAPTQNGRWAALGSLLFVASLVSRRRRSSKRRAA